MKKHSQKGFGAVEIIVAILVLCLIGGAVWFVLSSKKDSKNDGMAAQPNSTSQSSPSNTNTSNTSSRLAISEWGVKIANPEADKLRYVYYKYPESEKEGFYGTLDSSIGFYTKAGLVKKSECEDLGVGYQRYASLNSDGKAELAKENTTIIEIDKYYYVNGGSPGYCGDDSDKADNEVRGMLVQSFRGSNLESLN